MSLSTAVSVAYECRRELHGREDQSVYRLFHGYGEGQPGLTIDRFGGVAVVTHKVDIADELEAITRTLLEHFPFDTIVARAHRYFNWDSRPLSVTAVHGTLPTEPVEVRDNGLRFLTTPHTTESVGLFLDSRPARGWLLENSRGRRILNLFAYTGSLGVAAAAGGATAVVHVDNKAAPLEVARRNHTRNSLPVDSRGFLRGNVYKHLPHAKRAGLTFDGIILDPPPRVPDRMARRKPVGQDFAQLTALATPLLAPGGWLLCFFSRFDRRREAFEQDVADGAGVPLEVTWRGTSGEDFPEDDAERKLRLTAFKRT